MKIFTDLLEKYDFRDIAYKIIFREGDVQKVLWEICQEEQIDLLISGALRKEPLQKQYFGSIARGLARNPRGRVMLVPEPQIPPSKIENILVSVDPDNGTAAIETGFLIASKIPGTFIHFVQESILKYDPEVLINRNADLEIAGTVKKLVVLEEQSLSKQVSVYAERNASYSTKIIFGHSGSGIVDYAREIGADLIIDIHPDALNDNRDESSGRNIDKVLSNLPCRLLLFNN